jgi:hypothetical protein
VVTGVLKNARTAALWVIAVLVTLATATSFGESYRGLYLWDTHHGLSGLWAYLGPLMVDTFVAVGEAALFVSMTDRWEKRDRLGAWTVTLVGLVVSVAGNVGHVTSAGLADRLTAAVPPLAAASALAVGLGVLKRVVAMHHQAGTEQSAGQGDRPVTDAVTGDRSVTDTGPDGVTDAVTGDRSVSDAGNGSEPADRLAVARELLADNPELSGSQLAELLGVSPSTGQRYRRRAIRGRHAANGDEDQDQEDRAA